MLTALAARAKLRAWGDVDALLTTKVSCKKPSWRHSPKYWCLLLIAGLFWSYWTDWFYFSRVQHLCSRCCNSSLLSLPKIYAGPVMAAAIRSEKGAAPELCFQRDCIQPVPKGSAMACMWSTFLAPGEENTFSCGWRDCSFGLTMVWFSFQNWLGYTKKKAPIGFHRVVEILQRNNAPVQVSQQPLLVSCSLLGFGV